MSELRHDPIARRWVVIATDRARRPSDFRLAAGPRETAPEPASCPFCPGHEAQTPPEIAAVRPEGSLPNRPDWKVRCFPNRYPALAIEGQPNRKGVGPFDRMHGIGAHEVIVDSPDHGAHLADLPLEQIESLVEVCQGRLSDLHRDRRFRYALLFKNSGASAGASLAHPHTQIIATPVTPQAVTVELEAARAHHQVKERCLFCDLLDFELSSGERIVSADEHFVVLAPYASRFPFELLLIPRVHCHRFGQMDRTLREAFARCLRETLARLRQALADPPYNFVVHDAPNTEALPRRSHYWDSLEFDFHWHVEILPRLNPVAGFEWGTGFYINPTAPEDAAAFLRETAIA